VCVVCSSVEVQCVSVCVCSVGSGRQCSVAGVVARVCRCYGVQRAAVQAVWRGAQRACAVRVCAWRGGACARGGEVPVCEPACQLERRV